MHANNDCSLSKIQKVELGLGTHTGISQIQGVNAEVGSATCTGISQIHQVELGSGT